MLAASIVASAVDFLEDNVDLAIRAGELKDSSLMAKKVGEVNFKLYASAKYLKEHGEPTTLKELSDHVCVLFTPLSAQGWQLKNGKRKTIFNLNHKISVNDMTLALGLALEGAGIALLPSFFYDSHINSGKLIPIMEEWSSEIAPVHFVYPEQRYVSSVVRAFIEMSSVVLKKRFTFGGTGI